MATDPRLLAVAKHNNVVGQLLAAGGTTVDCVVGLSTLVDELARRLQQLEMIAPRKAVDKNGRCYIWHCPDALIPASFLIEDDGKPLDPQPDPFRMFLTTALSAAGVSNSDRTAKGI